MSQGKPEKLESIYSEKDLCALLNLPVKENSGRSVQLSYWIRGGLKHAEKANRRYFFEQDVIDYLWARRNEGTESSDEGDEE